VKQIFIKITSAWLGISVGALVSVVCGLVYIVGLHEPGSLFYPFAGLAFLGGSLFGGMVAASKAREHRREAFFISSGVIFGVAWALFIFTYAVLPQFVRTNVQLPAFCTGFDGSFNPPAHLMYTLPGGDTGILIASNTESAVVALVDYEHPPFPSTVFLVNDSDNEIIGSMRFNNDVISATIDEGIVYIYNDKLGYLIDARTGKSEESFLLIDNYGGLTETDKPIISRASSGHWYMETTAVISSWNIDGTVKSRPHLTFNGIARGCFISGSTREVIRY